MKKFLVAILFALFGFVSFAQNDSCSYNNVYINDTFYKARGGEIYDTCTVFITLHIDTTYVPIENTTMYDTIYDTTYIKNINLCLGDELIMSSYGTYDSVRCEHCDSLSTFYWYFGNGDSTIINGVDFVHVIYTVADCYDVVLTMTDSANCGTKHDDYIQIKISENPIRTVFSFPPICQYEKAKLNVGYGSDANIKLREIENIRHVSKTNDVKTFIPDGPNCPVLCYDAPVTFTEFPAGKTIESAEDICSVCINFEHSYMGDYRLTLKCPNNQSAILKYGSKCSGFSTQSCDPLVTDSTPSGSYGGGSQYTGIPYGGQNDGAWDNFSRNYCDSIYNMYGVGYEYCFSRNSSYTFASGNNAANPTLTTDDYIASTNNNYTISVTHTFNPIPAPYAMAGQVANTSTFRTKLPSDSENKINYYAPAEDFSSLIGCPLNGNWSIEVCDFWGQDNGWVFSWSMDICGVTRNDCEYKIELDSVVWHADENLNFEIVDSATAYIYSDTFGDNFPVYLSVYDNFGCKWDTNSAINVVHTPAPNLGPDTSFCPNDYIILNGYDNVPNQNYIYTWSTGETTESIIFQNKNDKPYIVEVANNMYEKSCRTRDTVNLFVSPHPHILFDLNEYPLEGCEPYSVFFNNHTKAISSSGIYDIKYNHWIFSDGTYSTEYSPWHSFPAGQYDVKYIAISDAGCVDSVNFPQLITVFEKPNAAFEWNPIYGKVEKPVIFTNKTQGESNIYRWEYRYDYDYPYSWNTVIDENPTITWNKPDSYPVRLIAYTINIAPSGHIVECKDTIESNILIIDDILQFPNVVTPNNDGINDIFVIKNLVEGKAFPINSLYIYNKWGSLVYHVENINTIKDFWNPNVTNSPSGTYFYRFTGKGYTGNTEHNGVIELIR
ncbi:gliding motility-associated C-terminal domain-containing protein [uncultured Methanobrevibacter sp.]|uniref:T9SS type B sorting domain-containing protein n=1 Tax=uncultured Methanobrevibacter sp. TaxID=253161 RepID=UPI0025E5EB13|nr:gliding motility-associated C-terminal domain-containing protein [uncultured Methanobrevibacter sp.]